MSQNGDSSFSPPIVASESQSLTPNPSEDSFATAENHSSPFLNLAIHDPELKDLPPNGGETTMPAQELFINGSHQADLNGEEQQENGTVEGPTTMPAQELFFNGSHQADLNGEEQQENGTAEGLQRPAQSASSQDILLSTQRVAEGNGQQFKLGAGISGREAFESSQLNEGSKHHMTNSINISDSVLYNVAVGDEEGHSRQRILSFAAKRYASAVERNPEDYDALYNWALVLQESADNMGSDSNNPLKDQLLEEACKKYEEATKLCPMLHEAFYNWAIAISDRAKNRGRTKEAEELWKQACKRYQSAVQLNWNNPQALNNWGLALQELSGIVPMKDKQTIVKTAIKKFRMAIQLQFDFHRAVYNLGTVLYGLAEDTYRSGRNASNKDSVSPDLYSQSAIYIASAHALKPDYPVYRSALRLVHSMLPLPYLKTGYLTVSPDGNSLAPHSDWKCALFVLDHEALYQVEMEGHNQSPSSMFSGMASASSGIEGDVHPALRIEIADLVSLSPCADLSLPSGGGFCVDTSSGARYLIADTWEAVDSWVDAIRLAYTIYVRGYSDILAGILTG